MATYPGFTYDRFMLFSNILQQIFLQIKNYKLNTTFQNHDKLRLCCEYFQKWIIEQAITFKN